MQFKRRITYVLLAFLLLGIITLIVISKSKKTENSIPITFVETTKDSVFYSNIFSEFFDFENIDIGITSSEKAFSGNKSTKVTPDIEYGFGINKTLAELPDLKNTEQVFLEFMCLAPQIDSSILFVFTISNSKNESVLWEGKAIVVGEANTWIKNKIVFNVKPEWIVPDNSFRFYIWNRDKKELHVDDLKFTLYGKKIYKELAISPFETNFFFDFENTNGITGTDNLKETTAHSGKIACDLSEGQEFGISVVKKMNEISSEPITKISASVWFYPLTDNTNTVLTASIVNEKKETVFWGGKGTDVGSFPKNKWTKMNVVYAIPTDKLSMNDIVTVNIWNKGKNKIIADDLEIVYGELPNRKGESNMSGFLENKFTPTKNKPPFQTAYFNNHHVNVTSLETYEGNNNFYSGDFIADKNNLDELLCVKVGKANVFSYNAEKKSFEIKLEIIDSEIIWDDSKALFTADFDGDNKCDFLFIDKVTGETALYNLSDNKLKEGRKIQSIDKMFLKYISSMTVTKKLSNKKNATLTFVVKNKIHFLVLNGDAFETQESTTSEIFNNSDKLYSGAFFKNNVVQFLQLNTNWRFDLKLVEQNKSDFEIKYVVDFKGYKNDYNPKYYELTKLITGNFIASNKTSIVVISCNCKDNDFDGINCKTFENIKELPNAINVYSINAE